MCPCTYQRIPGVPFRRRDSAYPSTSARILLCAFLSFQVTSPVGPQREINLSPLGDRLSSTIRPSEKISNEFDENLSTDTTRWLTRVSDPLSRIILNRLDISLDDFPFFFLFYFTIFFSFFFLFCCLFFTVRSIVSLESIRDRCSTRWTERLLLAECHPSTRN